MKKNPVFYALPAFLIVPVLILAQEKAPAEAPAAETKTVADTATEVVDTTVEAVENAAEAVADASVKAAELMADRFMSVFERAQQKDAWDLRLSVFAEIGDNRDHVPDGYDPYYNAEKYGTKKEKDPIFGIQPTIAFNGSFANTQYYKLGYSPIYQYWSNPRIGSLRSEFSHVAVAEYRVLLDRRNELSFRDDFKYIENDYWYLDSEDLDRHTYLSDRRTEHEQKHLDNTLTGTWLTQLTRQMSLRLSAYWLTIRYDDEMLALTNDEDKYVANANLLHNHNSELSYGIFGKYELWDDQGRSWTESHNGEPATYGLDRSIETYTLGLTATWRNSARFSIIARYGWEWIDYAADSIEDRDYPGDGDISAIYTFNLRTRGTFGFRYGVTESWVYPYASQDLYSFYAGLKTMHSKTLSSAIRLEYKISEYDTKYIPTTYFDQYNRPGQAQKVDRKYTGQKNDIYAEFRLIYRWNQNLDITAYYSYENVDSDISVSYTENTIGIRATYLF